MSNLRQIGSNTAKEIQWRDFYIYKLLVLGFFISKTSEKIKESQFWTNLVRIQACISPHTPEAMSKYGAEGVEILKRSRLSGQERGLKQQKMHIKDFKTHAACPYGFHSRQTHLLKAPWGKK